jgi:hypothetical protein
MKRIALPIVALLLTSCVCTNRQIDFTLATEAPQVLRLEPDGIDRVKVVPIGQPPTIYYYAQDEPLEEGYPAEVRWILTWDKNAEPEFDELVIVEKSVQSDDDSKGLLGLRKIAKEKKSGKSGRVSRLPAKERLVWSYQILVKRGDDTVGTLDPDIIVQKVKPRG